MLCRPRPIVLAGYWFVALLPAATLAQDEAHPVADIREVPPDLQTPPLVDSPAAAGRRVRQVTPGWEATDVYHALYLPVDWNPRRRWPLIVEYTGNGPFRSQFGDKSDGRVEDADMGYGISGGRGFVWVSLPYVNAAGTANVTRWWGDPPDFTPQPTLDYCRRTVAWISETCHTDPDRVLLVGFSRGAIACNYLGLHDDQVATLWRAMIPYSHYDGVNESWPYPNSDRASARARLARLAGRPQLICSESSSGGVGAVTSTQEYLRTTGVEGEFTFLSTGFRNHDDAWLLRPGPARSQLRAWVDEVLGGVTKPSR
jgi:hypothetical protein